jgi:UDP-GlcNAc:undecaprenyl-phosphate/decaprenyl-phosphate GlcNAc-1-phosphate transferase
MTSTLYGICFLSATAISLLLTPLMRWAAIRLNILDHPHSDVKTHKLPIPYLGGVAIAIALAYTLTWARLVSNFPTGTLRALRGIFLGSAVIMVLGLVDDIKPKGLGYRFKFLVQVVAALCLISFGIRIQFITPAWVAKLLTIVWVVGVINAFNIVDIMDGLASGLGVLASLGFFFISLPSEQIYVNFAAIALAGALLGFMPFNFSTRFKIFMGDSGSLLLGFMMAALSLGTSYTRANNAGLFAPILILGIPLYDTVLVSILRLRKGMSPFIGSHDHFALRLERYGLYREEILVLTYALSLLLTFSAYQVTVVRFDYALVIYAAVGSMAVGLGSWLAKIH